MPVTIDYLSEAYPKLYHMAHKDSLPSIRKNGLLSTSALLDLFDVKGAERERIESMHRPDYTAIENEVLGRAWIRDQKPMSDSGLQRALPSDLSPRDWYEYLNTKVFFWASANRLNRLLGAKAYRHDWQLVLTLDSRKVLEENWERVILSPINSGCTKPYPWSRDRGTFLPPDQYPMSDWIKKRGKHDAVAEIAIEGSVTNIEAALIDASLVCFDSGETVQLD